MASSSREAGGHSLLVSCICRFNSFQRPPLFSRLTPNFEFYDLGSLGICVTGGVSGPSREGGPRQEVDVTGAGIRVPSEVGADAGARHHGSL